MGLGFWIFVLLIATVATAFDPRDNLDELENMRDALTDEIIFMDVKDYGEKLDALASTLVAVTRASGNLRTLEKLYPRKNNCWVCRCDGTGSLRQECSDGTIKPLPGLLFPHDDAKASREQCPQMHEGVQGPEYRVDVPEHPHSESEKPAP